MCGLSCLLLWLNQSKLSVQPRLGHPSPTYLVSVLMHRKLEILVPLILVQTISMDKLQGVVLHGFMPMRDRDSTIGANEELYRHLQAASFTERLSGNESK